MIEKNGKTVEFKFRCTKDFKNSIKAAAAKDKIGMTSWVTQTLALRLDGRLSLPLLPEPRAEHKKERRPSSHRQ